MLTLIAVVATNFVLFHLMPGDPVTHIARGQHLDAEAIARLRTYYGLDQPMASQFVTYLQNLLRGDLGFSYTYQASVGPIVVKALANTLILVTVSTLLVILLGVLIGGVFAASRRGTRTDSGGLVIGSLVFWSLPTFWVGMLLIFVFAVTLGWFPIAGMYTADALYPTAFTRMADLARHLVLPTVAMVFLVDIAQFVLITRSSLLATLSEDYMTTARAKGLTPAAGAVAPWRAQCAAARGDRHHALRQRHRRRHHSSGDGVLLARYGTADLPVGDPARLPGDGSLLPDLRGSGRAGQLRQ